MFSDINLKEQINTENVISGNQMISLSSFFDGADPYIAWLDQQQNPAKSYLEHPFESESELKRYKARFMSKLGLSLGAFIRIKRVFYVLNINKQHSAHHLFFNYIHTPIGMMLAVESHHGLVLLEFIDRKMLESELVALSNHFKSDFVFRDSPFFDKVQTQIDEYFNLTRKRFTLKLDWVGTGFQQSVWQGLCSVDYGDVTHYSEQAKKMGLEQATRAVASANGKNKIAIVVPCHRIIRKDGTLGGYGGGLKRKKYLLALEQASI